jgi:hypothetical protein
MEFREALQKLEQYAPFKDWKKINKDSYLTHGFAMMENAVKDAEVQGWQIGYYDKKKDRITVFDISESITQSSDEEVFKKDKTVKALDLTKVKITLQQAMEQVDKIKQEKYKAEVISKKIILLQHIKEGNVWNITYLSMSFNILNVKINAVDGTILQTTFESLLRWKQ